jgi:hypothetical protein
MRSHYLKARLLIGLILVAALLGSALTSLAATMVDIFGGSLVFHNVVVESGAGVTALAAVALYEVFVAPWHP